MATRLIFASLIIWIYIFSTNGCRKETAPATTVTPKDIGETYVPPAGTGAAKIEGIDYEYVATADREANIIAGFKNLEVGQSREAVRKLLGPPDVAHRSFTKGFRDEFLGWYHQYKIRMRTDGPYTNDVCVEVFFDTKGKLHWAVPENVPDLREIGQVGTDPASK